MALFSWILQRAYGCHHRERSRVFTINRRTYQVCLDCGQEREYSWSLMHATRASAPQVPYRALDNIRHGDSAAARVAES
jgi:hypothetical protein